MTGPLSLGRERAGVPPQYSIYFLILFEHGLRTVERVSNERVMKWRVYTSVVSSFGYEPEKSHWELKREGMLRSGSLGSSWGVLLQVGPRISGLNEPSSVGRLRARPVSG